MKVEHRTFIVSGGSSGLGLATAQLLLESGGHIAMLDLAEPAIHNERVKFFKTDIKNVEEIERAVEHSVKWADESRAPLGGVINCAGVGTAAKILDGHNQPHSLDLWDFTLAVNLTGTFNLTRLALPHMASVPPEGPDGERGVVILAASSAAFEGQPGQAAYSASKGALTAMVLPLARDLSRHGIRVCAIAPGAFASAMTDRMPARLKGSLEREAIFPRRFGEAKEFAQTVKWIMECSYVNGETVRLTGGSRLPGRL